MDQKEYVKLLQEAVAKSPTPDKDVSPSTPRDDSTVKKIVNWDGTGDLPETLERDELDEMVDEILTKDESSGKVKEEKEEAPLEKLEGDEAGETDNEAGLDMEIDEADMTFSDDESEILKKLITEMDELETELDLTAGDSEEILDLEDELEEPSGETADEIEDEFEDEEEENL